MQACGAVPLGANAGRGQVRPSAPERGREVDATVSSESSEILHVEGEMEAPGARRNARLVKGPPGRSTSCGNMTLRTSCRPEQARPQALAGPRASSPGRSSSAQVRGREGNGSRSPKAKTKPSPKGFFESRRRPDARLALPRKRQGASRHITGTRKSSRRLQVSIRSAGLFSAEREELGEIANESG
jgi:hypothetical protein